MIRRRTIFLLAAWPMAAIISSKNGLLTPQGTVDDASTSAAGQHSYCPVDIMGHLNCTGWLVDAFDKMDMLHGSVVSKGGSVNSTELKLCESDVVPAGVRSAGTKMASGVALLKCNQALIEFRFHPPNGHITCGAEYTGKDTRGRPIDPGRVFKDVDALFATDLNYGNSFQHDIPNGLNAASVMWNLVSDRPDLHVLTGTILSDLYVHLLGSEDRVHFIRTGQHSWWFRSLYLGTVPEAITFSGSGRISPSEREIAGRIQYHSASTDPMLPCSVYAMPGFQEWRTKFSNPSGDHRLTTNGTLLYLQRTHRRYYVVSDCGKGAFNGTCSCRTVPEDAFVERLRELSHRHGLETEVFRNKNLWEDAAAVSKARVVMGGHGGAFANTLFLDPELDPTIVETNLQQEPYGRSQKRFGWTEEPRPIFAHLAAALGHRYVAYQPHVWRDYSVGDMRMSLEINDYLEFVDGVLSNEGDASPQWGEAIAAPFHPCVGAKGGM